MTTTMHKRSVHIDAPVETVFDYVKDPHHFFEAFPEKDRTGAGRGDAHPGGGRVDLQMGAGCSCSTWRGPDPGEYIPNERIVDHAWVGPVWIYTFEPDQTGTTLSLAFEWSTKVPLADEVIDRVSWDGDRDLDVMLANLKKAIEA